MGFEKFDPGKEKWENYKERMELWFETQKIKAEDYNIYLLTLLDAGTYGILKDLLAPALPKSTTYENITAALSLHYNPKKLELAERFKFANRKQLPGESYTDFTTELRKLSAECDFGDFLDEALSLMFTCGISDEAVQKRLIMLEKPKFKDILELALCFISIKMTPKYSRDPDTFSRDSRL